MTLFEELLTASGEDLLKILVKAVSRIKAPATPFINLRHSLMEATMIVRDVMSRRVVSVMPGHSVRHAAQIMLDNRVSGLPVVDGDGRLVGILTEGDLLRRVEYGLSGTRPLWIEAASPQGAARDFVLFPLSGVSDVQQVA